MIIYEVTAPHSSARRSLLFCASPQRRRYTSDEIEIRRLGIRSVRNGSSDRPGDDFFRYANGTWINKRQIPPDKPRVLAPARNDRSDRTAAARDDGIARRE